MNDLRIAVERALTLSAATRLIAIDTGDLVDAALLEVYAGVVFEPKTGARTAVADPLRLPFVAGLADRVLGKLDLAGEPPACLREVWRILAPAGVAVFVVTLPRRYGLKRLVTERFGVRRLTRQLNDALFEVETCEPCDRAMVIRASKSDGLAPAIAQGTAAVHAAATV